MRLLLLALCTVALLQCGIGVARSSAASLGGVSCPSGTQCTAVDSRGGEVTFAPGSGDEPGTMTAPIVYLVDGGQGLSDVACPSAQQCTAVGSDGIEVTFDPTSITPNNTYYTIDAGQNLSRVACPSLTQCTTVDESGDEVTFDPTPGHTPTGIGAAVGANEDPLADVVCPTTGQCTAVGSSGSAVTFTPGPTPNTKTQPLSNTGVNDVACLSTTSCVAVDDDSYESSFNPDLPTAQAPASHDVYVYASDLACPGSHQCTAANGNAGEEETFDPFPTSPTTPGETAMSGNVDSDGLNALDCLEANECVAVDGNGGETTFNPNAMDPTTTAVTIDSGSAVGNPGSNGGGSAGGGGGTTPSGGTTGGGGSAGGGTTGGNYGAQPTGSENALTLGQPTPADYGVNVPTTCSAGSGNCNVTANMSWVVGPAGYAATDAHRRTRRVIVARLSVKLRPGQRRVLHIRLNHVGRELLRREKGRLPVRLTVVSNGQTVYSKALQIKA